MFIGMIVFWALLIFGTAYIIRIMADSNGRRPSTVNSDSHPLEILRRRYAEGELSKEQFEAMKRELA